MAPPIRPARTKVTPGFAIEIRDDTELGLAMLVAEFAGGHYQPIAVVVSLNEAREIAACDLRYRMNHLENGANPTCPETYAVWAQGLEGDYRDVRRFMP
jgi:hypothetical protein